MKEMTLSELKKVQVEILDYLTEYCDKKGIHLWIDSGTLLGAIRHKGYIPWDDDIDTGVLREDYDKLIKNFNKDNIGSKYKLVCIEEDKNFFLPHAKIVDTETVLKEINCVLGVNIDVFVYDNCPDDVKIINKLFDKRDKYRMLFNIKNKTVLPKKPLKRIIFYTAYAIFSLLPCDYFIKKMVKNCKTYQYKDTKLAGNFSAFSRSYFNKSTVKEFTKVEFEGKLYNAPKGYDEYLRCFYGDYMQLPPEEKRVTHHVFKAYFKSEEGK